MSSTTSYRMSVGIGETITGILNRAENDGATHQDAIHAINQPDLTIGGGAVQILRSQLKAVAETSPFYPPLRTSGN